MSENDWLYTEVENTRLTFERLTHWKPPTDIIKRFNNLLQEDASSLSSRSSASRSIRTRARKLAIEIRKELGPEVLLLVVLVAKSLAKMAALSQESSLIHKLNEWWTTASHPSSLTKAASVLIVGYPPSETSVRQNLPVEAATTEQHPADALEKAFTLAAQSIPNPQDREDWLTSAAAHTRLLRLLSRSEVNPWDAFTRTVQWSDLIQLGSYLGAYLSNGIQESCMRKAEEQKGLRLTDTVRLLPPSEQHEDFGLEIWLHLSVGESIAQQVKDMRSIEDWKIILGNYLYRAMLESRFRKSEEDKSISRTSAARISFPNGKDLDHDSRLAILISFEKGTEIWSRAFPK
ncbi:hypothetical protein A1F97_05632 [Pyrenophora tritici-repentis]|nr:hypothetical protein PtrEW7m1_011052 [Pyrenophora tritici-repentis]PZD39769.1 hypothetical protein A1F97_05632 [Pyrenophora tritici-repentis]